MVTAALQRAHPGHLAWLDRIGWLAKPSNTPFRNRNADDPDVHQPLHVPGLGCPMYAENPDADRFAHVASDWSQPRLTWREIQMLRAMNELTDLHDWNLPPVIDAWLEIAIKMYLVSDKTWDWCRRELHDLADKYQQRKFVTIFDSSSRVCKSDILMPPQLLATLQSAIPNLLNMKAHDENFDLVDPSMFPFVHGRTRVFLDGTQVPLRVSTEFIGCGEVTEPLVVMRPDGYGSETLRETHLLEMAGELVDDATKARFYRGSERFQWLPCAVGFAAGDRDGVEILSYVNNFHPEHHRLLYRAIEDAISLSTEPWNEVFAYPGKPRAPLRIRTYGVQWGPERPAWADEDLLQRLDKMAKHEKETGPEYQRVLGLVDEYEKLINHEGSSAVYYHDEYQKQSLYIRVAAKHRTLYHWEHPEPGDSFTYDEWKMGRSGRAIVGGRERRPLAGVPPGKTWEEPQFDYPDHNFHNVNLREKLKDKGLQVIVRIASVDVDQQTPHHPGTEWQVNGFLNEHIVATSLILFDTKDITQSFVSFRVEADLDPADHQYEGFNFQEIAAMYGLEYNQLEGGDALQELGQVKISQGRMLVYPNTLQHKWNGFELAPGASAGHMRYLEIHLVDPHYRLVSTQCASIAT
ncbi:hypothetical protein SCUP515_07040 [Seiridium cupressi]